MDLRELNRIIEQLKISVTKVTVFKGSTELEVISEIVNAEIKVFKFYKTAKIIHHPRINPLLRKIVHDSCQIVFCWIPLTEEMISYRMERIYFLITEVHFLILKNLLLTKQLIDC